MPLSIDTDLADGTVPWGGKLRALLHASLNDDGTSKAPQYAVFSKAGPISVGPGVGRFLLPAGATIIGVVATINTAPTGAAVIVDVNKNGASIFTTQANRPQIAASATKTAATAVPDVTVCAAGDYLSVDVDQVGSTVAGSDLVVEVIYHL